MTALPAPSIPRTDDWITVDQAAVLTGQSLRRLQQRALAATGRGLARKGPPPTGTGKAVWWVHRSLDVRLTRYPDRPTRDDRERESLLDRHPAHHVELAYRKAHWLHVWRDRCRRPRPAGLTDRDLAIAVATEARQTEGERFRISARSLQQWRADASELGADGTVRGVEALIPRYRSRAALTSQTDTRSPDAIEWFYAIFRAGNQLSAKQCHAATLRKAAEHGWQWPDSYRATTRWLKEHDDRATTCLHRDGTDAYSHRYMPHLQTDWDAIAPGEMYVCDHTQCDFWAEYRSRQIRPWLTAIQDMRSRCIVGWHLGPTPHQDAIAVALRKAFADWAIPRKTRIDNGKDFTSKYLAGLTKSELRAMRKEFGRRWKDVVRRKRDYAIADDPRWLGLMPELGIELIYAIPYAPWSKGILERWFGTFEGRCGKMFASYCGRSPQHKPQCLQAVREGRGRAVAGGLSCVDTSDIPTLDDAARRIGDYIDTYHRTAHAGDGMRGRTPLQVWATAGTLRKAEPEALAFLASVRGAYKVTGNGVTLTVGGARLSYGRSHPALRRYAGREVLVAVAQERASEALAFDPSTRRLIGRLPANERIHPCATTDDTREAIAQIQRERKAMRQAERSAPRRMRTATQRINEHATAELSELRATGTDDAASTAHIVPVRTGFEGVSIPDRTPSDTGPDDPPRSVADLLNDGDLDDDAPGYDDLSTLLDCASSADDVDDDVLDCVYEQEDRDDESEPDVGLDEFL